MYPSIVLYDTFSSEEKWLDEMQQMLMAASDHVERLKIEKEKLSEHKWVKQTGFQFIFCPLCHISLCAACERKTNEELQ